VASASPREWGNFNPLCPLESTTCCFGLIPQEIPWMERYNGGLDNTLGQLAHVLETTPFSAVGEIGLDDRFSKVTPMLKQLAICESLAIIAQEYSRPVILHVVQADGNMVALLRKMKLTVPILWHGFLGSVETARELSNLGCTISIAPSIWRLGTKLTANLSTLKPPVLLETDFPFHYRLPGESSAPYAEVLEKHYRRYADAIGIPLAELEDRCDGYATVFTH